MPCRASIGSRASPASSARNWPTSSNRARKSPALPSPTWHPLADGDKRGCRAEHLLAAERAPPQAPGIGLRAQTGRGNRRRCPLQPGTPSLMVINEDAVPSIYWQPSEPRLKRQELAYELKQGAEIAGVALSNPEPVLSVRTR